MATAIVVVIFAAAAMMTRNFIVNRTYTSYTVESEADGGDSVSSYEYADGFVVRYSQDGASLIDKNLQTIWTSSFTMTDPRVDVRGGQIMIYDCLGNSIRIFNEKEQVAEITTSLPILKASVSKKDTAAVLLRDGEKVNLVYYAKDGSEIAAGESSMKNSGYPVSLSLSDDGKLLAVSYVTAADGTAGSLIRIYNFGSAGKDRENHVVGEFTFKGTVAPEVRYLEGNRCVVFRDDGFVLINGASDPSVSQEVTIREDICSTFCDESNIGLVVRSEDKDNKYEMQVYSGTGRLKVSKGIDISYDRVRVCGNQVIISGSTEFEIWSTGGVCRFAGRLKEGNITDALKIGSNRFLIISDRKMEVIALK